MPTETTGTEHFGTGIRVVVVVLELVGGGGRGGASVVDVLVVVVVVLVVVVVVLEKISSKRTPLSNFNCASIKPTPDATSFSDPILDGKGCQSCNTS